MANQYGIQAYNNSFFISPITNSANNLDKIDLFSTYCMLVKSYTNTIYKIIGNNFMFPLEQINYFLILKYVSAIPIPIAIKIIANEINHPSEKISKFIIMIIPINTVIVITK